MSDNVGLSTPRGSGTSGYVQRNLSTLKSRSHYAPYPPRDGPSSNSAYRPRQPNKEILEHDRLREIEVKVLEYQDKLEEEDEEEKDESKRKGEEEIERLVGEYRERLSEEVKGGRGPREDQGSKAKNLKKYQVHELAEAKAHESERLRRALGIKADFDKSGGVWGENRERDSRLRDSLKEDDTERERQADGPLKKARRDGYEDLDQPDTGSWRQRDEEGEGEDRERDWRRRDSSRDRRRRD